MSFAGTARGIEARVVPREGFALDLIRSGGLKGKSTARSRARRGAAAARAWLDAWRIVSARRPDLVIGVGGYSSGPVVLVAALRGIPTMLLEQNAVPGLTNRLLARVVRAAAVTFESTRAFFGAKAFVSGNPVRPEFLEAAGRRRRRRGGCIGGQGPGLWRLSGRARDQRGHGGGSAAAGGRRHRVCVVTHQTGERDVEMVRAGVPAGRAARPSRAVPLRHGTARSTTRTWSSAARARRRWRRLTAAGKAGDSDSAADGDRRPPAQERRGAGGGRRGGGAAAGATLTGERLAARILALAGDRGAAAADGGGGAGARAAGRGAR